MGGPGPDRTAQLYVVRITGVRKIQVRRPSPKPKSTKPKLLSNNSMARGDPRETGVVTARAAAWRGSHSPAGHLLEVHVRLVAPPGTVLQGLSPMYEIPRALLGHNPGTTVLVPQGRALGSQPCCWGPCSVPSHLPLAERRGTSVQQSGRGGHPGRVLLQPLLPGRPFWCWVSGRSPAPSHFRTCAGI